MPFKAPVVDELSVRVVVDSRYERFLPKASHPLVKVEHIGRIPGRPDMTFAAEWGLSLHLASAKEARARAAGRAAGSDQRNTLIFSRNISNSSHPETLFARF